MPSSSLRFAPMMVERQSAWDVAQVKAALDEHEEGRFFESAKLFGAFGRDSQIATDLGTLASSFSARADVGGLPFAVDPSDSGDQRRAGAIATKVQRLWWDVITEQHIDIVVKETAGLGAHISEITWRSEFGQWVPVLHPLPPDFLEYREFERRWVYHTQNGEVTVTPGDGRFFFHQAASRQTWMTGAVRALGVPFVLGTFSYDDWSRYNEKHGLPVLAVNEPYYAADDVDAADGVGTIYKQAQNLSSEGIFRLPQGQDREGSWDAKWLELVGRSYDSFRLMLERLDSVKSMVVLGRPTERKALGGDGESEQARAATEKLVFLANGLATSIRDQIWKPWGRFNEPNWDDRLAPWGRWNLRPKPDLKARAEILDKAADAAGKLKVLGADIDPIFAEFDIQMSQLGPDEIDVDLSELEATA